MKGFTLIELLAVMRANKTANVYNEYMLKNSYVFDGNIPSDINYQLEIIK